jgi:hypothetical protein
MGVFINHPLDAPVAQWIERLFPKQKVVGSTPTWRALYICFHCTYQKKK